MAISKKALTAPQEEITARAERIVFYNQDNGYIVLSATPIKKTNSETEGASNTDNDTSESAFDASASPLSFVGYVASPVRTGERYTFTGAFQNHSKWGQQFHFSSASLILPTGREGVAAYIASVAYSIGPAKAARIVEALGPTCLDVIRERGAEALAGIPGVREEQAAEIAKAVAENATLAELSALVCCEQISPRLAAKIYAVYSDKSVERVRENPYLLADEVWGIGFAKADRVARRVGIAEDSPFRIEAAVQYVIKEAQNDGHCFLDPRHVNEGLKAVLGKDHGIDNDAVAAAAGRLIASDRLIREGDAVYTPALYRAEQGLAGIVRKRMAHTDGLPSREDAEDAVASVCSDSDLELDESQWEAIITALTAPTSVITGGPGSGKSTITRVLLDAYDYLNQGEDGDEACPIYLCSPTGRAAKRLAEVTGREAQTIHRLLEYRPGAGFLRNKYNPLYGPGLLVGDEVSMADISLAYSLFQAIPDYVQVVLVGDIDQLPSVGPGSVLRDIIASGAVPTTRLNFTYRQKEGSRISYIANLIREGVVPDLCGHEPEVMVYECGDQEEAAQVAVRETLRCIEKYGLMGCQALAPQYRGASGVDIVNRQVREAVLGAEAGPEVHIGATAFKVGDKIMVVKNDYNKDVFNGDCGQVVALAQKHDDLPPERQFIDDPPGIYVSFSDGADTHSRQVFFNEEDAGKLTLAYCCTIHKAQGSEFPAVVMLMTRGHYMMLQRNLFYTGLTRAKRELVLVVQGGAVERAVRNDKIKTRFSRLKELLAAAE